MSEENVTTEVQETVETPAPELSINAQAKALPWVQDLMKKAKDGEDLKAQQEQAKVDAEQKRLKDAGLFDEAAKLHKDTIDALESKHTAELQNRDLTTELLKAGFTNEIFLKGSVLGYNAENNGSILEYVAALATDEANKAFLGSGVPVRDPKDPPTPAGTSGSSLGNAQLRALANSDKPEDRLKAATYLKDYVNAHKGQFPSGYIAGG